MTVKFHDVGLHDSAIKFLNSKEGKIAETKMVTTPLPLKYYETKIWVLGDGSTVTEEIQTYVMGVNLPILFRCLKDTKSKKIVYKWKSYEIISLIQKEDLLDGNGIN